MVAKKNDLSFYFDPDSWKKKKLLFLLKELENLFVELFGEEGLEV